MEATGISDTYCDRKCSQISWAVNNSVKTTVQLKKRIEMENTTQAKVEFFPKHSPKADTTKCKKDIRT